MSNYVCAYCLLLVVTGPLFLEEKLNNPQSDENFTATLRQLDHFLMGRRRPGTNLVNSNSRRSISPRCVQCQVTTYTIGPLLLVSVPFSLGENSEIGDPRITIVHDEECKRIDWVSNTLSASDPVNAVLMMYC